MAKLTIGAKIAIILLSIVALGAIVTTGVLLVKNGIIFDNPKKEEDDIISNIVDTTNQKNDDSVVTSDDLLVDLELLWIKIYGCWASENHEFLQFTNEGSTKILVYGLLDTEYSVYGEVTEAHQADENIYALTFFVPAIEASELFDAQPERTETVYINIGAIEIIGCVDALLENNGDNQWVRYYYVGEEFDYGDSAGNTTYTAKEICEMLGGYWIADTDQLFVGFISYVGNNEQVIEYGMFDTEYMMQGDILGINAIGPSVIEVSLHLGEIPETVLNSGYPERTEIILLDFNGFTGDDDSFLKVKIGALSDGDWVKYTYGGATMMEAGNTWHQNHQ